MKSKQDFILDTLRGYFQNPSTCAVEGGHCKYRTADGRKCALGQHIDDDAYDETMEGKSAQSLLDCGQEFLTEEARAQNLTALE